MPRGYHHHGTVDAGNSEEARALVHAIHPGSTILRLSGAEQQSIQRSPAAISAPRPLAIPPVRRSFVQRFAGPVIGFLLGIVLTAASFIAYERFGLFGQSVFGDWVLAGNSGLQISLFEDGTLEAVIHDATDGTATSMHGRVVRLGRGRYKAEIKDGDRVLFLRLSLVGDRLRVEIEGMAPRDLHRRAR